MKKLFVKTFGCQMNVYDSERMKDVLAPVGYMPTDSLEDADMVILNTCHIREKASEKVFSDLGRLRKLKDRAAEQQNRQILIVVAGCVAMALYMVVLLLDDNGADDNVDDVIGATMQFVSRFCWC